MRSSTAPNSSGSKGWVDMLEAHLLTSCVRCVCVVGVLSLLSEHSMCIWAKGQSRKISGSWLNGTTCRSKSTSL